MSDPITSPSNPRVKRVAKLVRDRRERDREGLFVAEGERLVGRAMAAGLRAVEVYATDGREGAVAVSPAAMDRMGYGGTTPDVIAVFETPRRTAGDLPTPAGEDVILLAVGTEKPGNLGAMARTAAAAGCSAVIAAGADVDVWNPNCLRNSTGAVFSLPTVSLPEDAAVAWLKRHGVRTLATVVGDGSGVGGATGPQSLWEPISRPPGPLAVVIGPEHAGLPAAWLEAADNLVTIPLAGRAGVDSLNASTAAAVVLFELARRRRRA